MKPDDKIWWFRFFLAVFAGLLCGVFNVANIFVPALTDLTALRGLSLALILYIISYYVVCYVFRITPDQLKKRRDRVFGGVFTYFVIWFIFWIFFYTIFKYFITG